MCHLPHIVKLLREGGFSPGDPVAVVECSVFATEDFTPANLTQLYNEHGNVWVGGKLPQGQNLELLVEVLGPTAALPYTQHKPKQYFLKVPMIMLW